ncbi:MULTISPECIES: hypothetical protein [Bacillaceae]|nr:MULTISPECIES: hypothetical protein [Bacillaceae]
MIKKAKSPKATSRRQKKVTGKADSLQKQQEARNNQFKRATK